MTNFEKLDLAFRQASAFIVGGNVCGDYSLSYLDDPEDGNIAFYIYGERGLYREYFVSKEMINNGTIRTCHQLTVTYYDGKPLTIQPLFPRLDSAT
ncbi:hypothetical protein GZ77_09445 [Endozoicomonas montiporae]|uniref:Uncharacterized protein n=2 Tax=Endozoicomonas montiporae TaxID=1027273 RepID=A0A081N7X3_9GAMM|nr:hypothetical protein [Endozoicomonas montiporae]AMO55582.1 hypothetical protein EZMO1_1394 [Endozoicomonas montiporae CL-33]AMO55583.1 hypothetical protein EZMO1_1395 [Endozoicomonas montiporae CL-33]KEQ14546.1 hypothetical protein GZ77_09440 [Endozoicomonas montiporae]KEQ14547.1 hypothetical protein GZ77_09445 [Endozoicomonas montiporae]